MDKFADALVTLIEQGAPLAKWVIVLHYTYYGATYFASAAVAVVGFMVFYKVAVYITDAVSASDKRRHETRHETRYSR